MKRTTPFSLRTAHRLSLYINQRSQSEGGYIIVVVGALIFAISAVLITAELAARVDSNSTKASGNSAAGFFAAEAGLNRRAGLIAAKFAGYNVPSGTSPKTATPCQNGDNGDGDFICNSSFSVQDYLYPNDSTKQIPVSTYVQDQNNPVKGVDQPTSITIPPGQPFESLSAQEYNYQVVSTAYDRTNNPTAFLGMTFKSRLVPLFQFAAFYNKDLEINPGANMTLSGPVFTNGDLYTDTAGSTILLYQGQVFTHGTLYRGRKDTNACSYGTVSVNDPAGTAVPIVCPAGGRVPITNVAPWSGQVKVGIPRVSVPTPDAIAPSSDSTYWKNSDLRIVLNLDDSGNPTGIQVNNTDTSVDATRSALLTNSCLTSNPSLPSSTTTSQQTATAGSQTIVVNSTTGFQVGDPLQFGSSFSNDVTIASIGTSKINNKTYPSITLKQNLSADVPIGTTVSKAIVSTTSTFYNFREGKYIRMLNVDVQGLMNCAYSQSLQDSNKKLDDTTNGGLVWYFTVKGPNSLINVYANGNTPTSGNNYGVRLYDASQLGAYSSSQTAVSGAPSIQGLTVVSDQAVYMQGDYNCGTWNSTTKTCSNKKPAAILADTINILSNAWKMNDPNTSSYPSVPTSCSALAATETHINAAFLSGTDTTDYTEGPGGQGLGKYNGGLENYPRLHENWSGIGLYYQGSFVSLNEPLRVSGPQSNACYNAANRYWSYDTSFKNAANLPPLSPRFVYLRQERFSRNFDRSASLEMPNLFASLVPSSFLAVLPSFRSSLFQF